MIGIGVWDRLELIEICVIPDGVDLYIPWGRQLIHLVRARNVRLAGPMFDETHLLRTRRLSQGGSGRGSR